MSTPVLLSTISEATAFLRKLDSNSQVRGEAYFRQGRVTDLKQNSANEIIAQVRGSQPEPYAVSLNFHPHAGWSAECSCPLTGQCKHVYAAMKALLAAHSIAQVQQLSAGKIAAPPPEPSSIRTADDLGRLLAAKVNRRLSAEEKKFLKKLESTYVQCLRTRRISNWEFDHLGLRLPGMGYDVLNIWPALPKDLHEFWLYIANAAKTRGVSIPGFMEPVTDLVQLQKAIQKWHRTQEVNRWKKTLEDMTDWKAPSASSSEQRHELRLRITAKSAVLEWKRPGREGFEPMKPQDGRAFRDGRVRGAIQLTGPEEWLWQIFNHHVTQFRDMELSYVAPDQAEALLRLLRLPAFDPVLVNPEGKPFRRSEEVLRWNLDPALKPKEDYKLRVVMPDGSPLPPVLCVAEGNPSMFVTHDTIFQGPMAPNKLIKLHGDNIIPAQALETRGGVSLLHSMGLELPPRLRERVRTASLQMVISCWLDFPKDAASETCLLRATGRAPNGESIEEWNGYTWQVVNSKWQAARAGEDVFHFYDRSALHDAGMIVSGLDARWDPFKQAWVMRVTKKFPEVFFTWLNSLPKDIKVLLGGELESFAQNPIAGNVRLDVKESEIDWFDLRVVLDIGDTKLSDEELKLLLDAKGGYVRLRGKGWRKLQFNLSESEDEQLARLGLNPRELTSEPQRLHALQLADDAAKKFLPEPQFVDIQRRAHEIKTRVTPDLPKSIQAELRPYQTEGFHFLAYLSENRFGGILADDMGLGKTLQTLTWLAWLRESVAKTPDAKKPSLVVCPKSVMDNWRAETERFAKNIRVKVWTASDSDQMLGRLAEADLHVLNYSQLRLLGESLSPVRWLALILDEGQYIKNPSSQTAQVARALNAQHRLVLSGTPIENRLLDLWSLMSFAMPGVLGSRAQFAKLYDAKEDPYARRRLSARVRPFLIRRTKTQVAKDLPDRIEEDLFCEMEGEQKLLYRAELKHAQQMLLKVKTQKQLNEERFHFLTSLLRLRQICCHPRLVKPDSKAVSAKVEGLLEQIEPLIEEGNKVLIFSQFVEMLDILHKQLKPLEQPLFYLAGNTENRGELVQKFQETEGSAIFLISLKAGGFGLNLTAASYVVLFDPWWNPAVENQAIDRTHRIGQKRNVIAYRLLIKDSIEEKIRRLQKTKSALAEDVLGEEKFSQSLSLEDLQFLFSE